MKPFLLLSALGIACLAAPLHAQEKKAPKDKGEDTTEDVSVPDAAAAEMAGTYVGAFGERKITVSIEKVVGTTVLGYSIVAGNERAFSGSWKAEDGKITVVAKEPGDHPADGVFHFSFATKPKALSGEWVANDKKIGTRKFDLPARKFAYNPKAGQYPQASARVLKEADVENLRPEELRIMRNEIYARRGYSFKLADMRQHFDALDWYMPVSVDISTKLSDTEKKNAELIKRYEKYSAEYYDDFGR
ncbi:YARHG domain-containing protein [Haloferula sp. BvORR071]|uniref:YARHG domain-containing protein n=1 Tax=Haloferula sp. BvORR071 TaxID=1396141 RepID=UPI00055877EE|nr:YARHG domain-containing protein [Haloferula sp. BvORR071]